LRNAQLSDLQQQSRNIQSEMKKLENVIEQLAKKLIVEEAEKGSKASPDDSNSQECTKASQKGAKATQEST
jgi:hypothetical protein